MLKWLPIPICLFALLSGFAMAQNIADDTENAPRPVKLVPLPPAGPVYIHCGALFGGKSDQLEQNVVIVIERDRIKQVGKFSPPAGAQVIDLPNLTCLPGMVESHTHVFLQGDRNLASTMRNCSSNRWPIGPLRQQPPRMQLWIGALPPSVILKPRARATPMLTCAMPSTTG